MNCFPFKVFFWVSTVIQRITYTYVELELTTLLRSYEIWTVLFKLCYIDIKLDIIFLLYSIRLYVELNCTYNLVLNHQALQYKIDLCYQNSEFFLCLDCLQLSSQMKNDDDYWRRRLASSADQNSRKTQESDSDFWNYLTSMVGCLSPSSQWHRYDVFGWTLKQIYVFLEIPLLWMSNECWNNF